MKYIWEYKTPEGFDDIVMCGYDEALTGLWFAPSRDAARQDSTPANTIAAKSQKVADNVETEATK